MQLVTLITVFIEHFNEKVRVWKNSERHLANGTELEKGTDGRTDGRRGQSKDYTTLKSAQCRYRRAFKNAFNRGSTVGLAAGALTPNT